MENEEMRRLAMFSNSLADQVEQLQGSVAAAQQPPQAAQPPGGDGGAGGDIVQNTFVTNNYGSDISIKMLSGEVWVNQRPQMPPDGGYPDSEAYKYANREYDPAHGKFGYYVYGLIRHFWDLPDRNNYVIELVDQHEKFRDPDYRQNYILQHEGLDTNTVILHAIYKPTDGMLEYDENGDLLTDLVFDFVLIGKPTADEYVHLSDGWILSGPVGTLWTPDIDSTGALLIDQVYDVEVTPMYLISPNGTVWEVTVTATVDGYALQTAEVDGIAGASFVYIRSSDGTLYLLSVDDDGALITDEQ